MIGSRGGMERSWRARWPPDSRPKAPGVAPSPSAGACPIPDTDGAHSSTRAGKAHICTWPADWRLDSSSTRNFVCELQVQEIIKSKQEWQKQSMGSARPLTLLVIAAGTLAPNLGCPTPNPSNRAGAGAGAAGAGAAGAAAAASVAFDLLASLHSASTSPRTPCRTSASVSTSSTPTPTPTRSPAVTASTVLYSIPDTAPCVGYPNRGSVELRRYPKVRGRLHPTASPAARTSPNMHACIVHNAPSMRTIPSHLCAPGITVIVAARCACSFLFLARVADAKPAIHTQQLLP